VDSRGLQSQFICMATHTIFWDWTGLESCLSPQESQFCGNPVDWNTQDCRGIHRTQGDLRKSSRLSGIGSWAQLSTHLEVSPAQGSLQDGAWKSGQVGLHGRRQVGARKSVVCRRTHGSRQKHRKSPFLAQGHNWEVR